MVWNSEEEHRINIRDETVATVDGEIEADKVREEAKAEGIKKFVVLNELGQELEASDFPTSQDIEIKPENVPK